MSNVSEVIIRSHHYDLSPEILSQADAWATKALAISRDARERSSPQEATCEVAFAVALFNVAALRRVSLFFRLFQWRRRSCHF